MDLSPTICTELTAKNDLNNFHTMENAVPDWELNPRSPVKGRDDNTRLR